MSALISLYYAIPHTDPTARDAALAALPPAARLLVSEKKEPRALAQSLAAYSLLARHADLGRLTRTNQRKPYLPDGPAFSLSHAADLAVLALAENDIPLGVDTEPLIPRRPGTEEKIAARFFTEAERRFLRTAPDPTHAFFRIWTRKEATLKATGEGLAGNMRRIDTLDPPPELAFDEYILPHPTNGTPYLITLCRPAGQTSQLLRS